MKKIAIALASALVICALTACSASGSSTSQQSSATAEGSGQAGKVRVVCTVFPAYDWINQILGDEADDYEVTWLLEQGVDIHSYQPTVEDIAKISECDLFVYVGGESEDWVKDALANAKNSNIRTVSLLEAVGNAAVEEEVVEGMQADEHEGDDASHEAEESELDEHVWLSLRNAQVLVDAIAGELAQIDADNAAAFEANAKAYKASLADLDARYAAAVKAGATDTLLFGDRFPFRYLTKDYGLKYYAAFAGCSAETEASFETVTFLAQKIDELGLKAVLTIDNSDQKIAKTIVQSTASKDQEILTMDSLQSTTGAEAAAGRTYLRVMEDNLGVLEKALG